MLGTDYVVQTKPSDQDKCHPNHVYNRQIELLAESAVGGQKSKLGPKSCYKDGKKSLLLEKKEKEKGKKKISFVSSSIEASKSLPKTKITLVKRVLGNAER